MKVLMTCTDLQTTGITSVIMNYCRNFRDGDIKVEIAAGKPVNSEYAEELEKLGIVVHELPSRRNETAAYRRRLKRLIKENGYDAVHVHGNSSTMVLELSVAKKYKVPVRIAHCHNSVCGSMLRHRLLYPFFKNSFTHAFACSDLAGEWIFGKGKFTVINNGVVVQNFIYDGEKRARCREELGVSDNFVIGHVGRFNRQKNHKFLLKVFEKVFADRPEARLLLVGSGGDYDEIKSVIDGAPYRDGVILYGESSDVAGLMSAMDVFAFPSKYEGLGIVCVEAQISGLQGFISDAVPRQALINGCLEYLPIGDKDVEAWANAIVGCKTQTEEYRLSCYYENIDKTEVFDICKNAQTLERFYKSAKDTVE